MTSYRKQNNVTNFRQYQAPPTNQNTSINSSNKSYYSYNKPSNNYSTNYQKKPTEERVPLNLTNYRANIMPTSNTNTTNNTTKDKLNSSFSPVLNYQFNHRVNYSKNLEKKEEPNPNYTSTSYNTNNSKIAKSTIVPNEDFSQSPSFQVSKSNNIISSNKDSESYFRPTSYHLKYSSIMPKFQYKDDYKPTEYVTKSSSTSSQLLKNIQEQNKIQSQNQNQNQGQPFDPNAKDQDKPNFDYNASLFFAKQALLNGSNYKQYRTDDFDQKDPTQTDLNQNYDMQKSSQPNYNSQFNLNSNDNNATITSYYSKSNSSNNDINYKSNFSFNNNNNDLYNNDNKSNFNFNNNNNNNNFSFNNNNNNNNFSFNSNNNNNNFSFNNNSNNNNNNFSFNNNNNNNINNNNNENEFDDDFLTKLKKSISTSVSGENQNAQPKYDRDSFTSFHMQKNDNKINNHSYDEETIKIDIPKKKERIDSNPAQNGNDNGLDLQAKLAKFRQTISLVRKTEEDYGDMFPQEKSKTEKNDDKDTDDVMLKDTTNDMLSEPSLIFADSPNQS